MTSWGDCSLSLDVLIVNLGGLNLLASTSVERCHNFY